MNALWMRVAANIGNRKVTWRAVTSLGIPRAAAVGYLVMFWGGALEAECNGYIAEIPDAQLEAWANWEGERGAFAQFIRAHHVTDGRINEWEEWAGVLEATRERERTKKRAQRAGKSPADDGDTPRDVPGDVPGKSPDKERKGKEGKVRGSSSPSARKNGASASDAPSPEFEAAWASYPRRKGTNSKHDAWKAWRARVRAGDDPAELHAGVQRYRAYCRAQYGAVPSEFIMRADRFFGPSAHFRETWAVTGTVPGDVLAITPARMREIIARHSLGRPGVTLDAYWEDVDDACPEELDGETWRALVLHVQPWEFAHLSSGRVIEEQLASRLATWRGATATPAGVAA